MNKIVIYVNKELSKEIWKVFIFYCDQQKIPIICNKIPFFNYFHFIIKGYFSRYVYWYNDLFYEWHNSPCSLHQYISQDIFQKRSLQLNAVIWFYNKMTKKFMSYNFYLIIHLYQSGLFKTFLPNKKNIAYILEICVITLKKMKCVVDTLHSPKWIF